VLAATGPACGTDDASAPDGAEAFDDAAAEADGLPETTEDAGSESEFGDVEAEGGDAEDAADGEADAGDAADGEGDAADAADGEADADAVESACGLATSVAIPAAGFTVVVSGDAALGSTEFADSVTCLPPVTYAGNQLYYEVSLEAGRTYRFRCSAAFEAIVYLFRASSCSSAERIGTDCGSLGEHGDWMQTRGRMEQPMDLLFRATTGGTYWVAVDSVAGSGPFSMEIGEYVPGTNGTCASAEPLDSTVSGEVDVSDTTEPQTNEFGESVVCGGTVPFDRPQLYYSIELAGPSSYYCNFDPRFDADVYLFQTGSCGDVAAINADCSGAWRLLHAPKGLTYTLPVLTAVGGGRWLIAVDSSSGSGIFRLHCIGRSDI
jgi:hypothetical protein